MKNFSNTIHIYCFSGTGNTLLVAKAMKEVFVEEGYNVEIIKMEKASPSSVRTDVIIGLAFPVAVQGTFPLVWEFVKNMPETNKSTPIFMVDTLEGFSGGVVGPMRRIVERKGYMPVGAEEIIMPSNLFNEKLSDEEIKRKREEGIRKAKDYAKRLLEGKTSWGRVPVLPDLLSFMSRSRKLFRRMNDIFPIKVKYDKCTFCGICEKICPEKNIMVDNENRIIKRDKNCIYCMRCVEFCPTEAIYVKGMKRRKINSVRLNEIM